MEKQNQDQSREEEKEPADSATEIIFEIEIPEENEKKGKRYYGGNGFNQLLTDLICRRKPGKKK